MKDLLDWAKAHAKPDANVAEFEELAKKYTIPETKETAWDFMQKAPAFKSAMDAEVSRAVAAHDVNFNKEKLPDIEKTLRDKLLKELKPEETREQKELREIREELAKERAEKALAIKRDALRKAASEKKFDPDLAAELAVFGDDAEAKLELFASKMAVQVKTQYEATAREKLGGSAPVKGTPANAKSQAEIDAMAPRDRFTFFTGGGIVKE